MGEEKIHSLYLQRKDSPSHDPSAYSTVPYAHAYEYASIRTSTHLAIWHVYKPQQQPQCPHLFLSRNNITRPQPPPPLPPHQPSSNILLGATMCR